MKSPSFENCQIGLCKNGKIEKVSEAFASWVGKAPTDLIGLDFRALFLSLQQSWNTFLKKDFYKKDIETFLPLSPEAHQSSIGIHFQNICYSYNSVISLSWIQGKLSPNQLLDISQSWIPEKSENYVLETYVWNSLNDSIPLSPPMITSIIID